MTDPAQQPVPALPSPVSISYGPFQPISPDEPRIPIEYIGPPLGGFELKAPESKKSAHAAQRELSRIALNSLDGVGGGIKA